MEALTKEDFTERLKKRILFHMEEGGVSKRRLALDLDIQRGNMQRLLKSKNCPSAYTMYQLCHNMNVLDKVFTKEFLEALQNNPI
jgi:hypothetical protein